MTRVLPTATEDHVPTILERRDDGVRLLQGDAIVRLSELELDAIIGIVRPKPQLRRYVKGVLQP
jgi:hypothetical protein